ncbi:hypothetical protein GEMRC1_011617 [Eukaryota sp. GEM-RC1]
MTKKLSKSQQVLLSRLVKESSAVGPEEALTLLSKALVISETSLCALTKRSQVFLLLGLDDSAIEDAQLALNSHPCSAMAHLNLAQVYLSLSQFENALSVLQDFPSLPTSSTYQERYSQLMSSIPDHVHDRPPSSLSPWQPNETSSSVHTPTIDHISPTPRGLSSSRKLRTPKLPNPPALDTVCFDSTPSRTLLKSLQSKACVDPNQKLGVGKYSVFQENLYTKLQGHLEDIRKGQEELLCWENRVLRR